MRIPESELIINSDGSVFHLHIRPDQLADRIVLVGDPGRVAQFKPFMDSIECETSSREFVSITGLYHGARFTVLSTGIGTDNIDIVMTELDALANVDFKTREPKAGHKRLTIMRLGTSGAIQPDIPLGSYVLSHMSIGCDGLLNWYADRDSICDLEMEKAFCKHVGWNPKLAAPYFVKGSEKLIGLFADSTVKGLTVSAPGFYGPQGRVVRHPLAMPGMIEAYESFRYGDMKITNFEMESSAISGLAAHLGHDAATVCCAIANRHLKAADTDYKPLIDKLILLVLDKLSTL